MSALKEALHVDPWVRLISSIRSHRSPGARFYKPVCVISAIDLTDEALIDPGSADPQLLMQRFRQYVRVTHPDREDQGWRPLWHLSNDGLWSLHGARGVVLPEHFGTKRQPDTRSELFANVDRVSIVPPLLPAWQSPEHRRALRYAMVEMLARDDAGARLSARQLTHPELALTPDKWPDESALAAFGEGVQQLDMFGRPTGVEEEEGETEAGRIAEPFDPESIDVTTRSMTIDLLMSRTSRGTIDLQPDFQRRWGIWSAQQQSRLIESLLLRIPLPVIYAAEDEKEKWEIVDGIQRLSSIARFVKPEIIGATPLALTGLEYLQEYEGRTFGELGERLQTRLSETELLIHLIRRNTPPEVKFNVFARINTGGVALSAQELRHAITPGTARSVLETWADKPEFVTATDASVRRTRMEDRELVLRFLAFHLIGPAGYRQSDMDGFLVRAMRSINRLSTGQLKDAEAAFSRSMSAARDIFGNDAFRKRADRKDGRHPINKALFETVSVGLAALPEAALRKLRGVAERVRGDFIELCRDRAFDAAISQGTGDQAKVKRRFAAVAKLFEDSLDAH